MAGPSRLGAWHRSALAPPYRSSGSAEEARLMFVLALFGSLIVAVGYIMLAMILAPPERETERRVVDQKIAKLSDDRRRAA
jgi:hypothetical protein